MIVKIKMDHSRFQMQMRKFSLVKPHELVRQYEGLMAPLDLIKFKVVFCNPNKKVVILYDSTKRTINTEKETNKQIDDLYASFDRQFKQPRTRDLARATHGLLQ